METHDKHATSRDAKRQKNKKMNMSGRSLFTIQRAEADRAERIDQRRVHKANSAIERKREVF